MSNPNAAKTDASSFLLTVLFTAALFANVSFALYISLRMLSLMIGIFLYYRL